MKIIPLAISLIFSINIYGDEVKSEQNISKIENKNLIDPVYKLPVKKYDKFATEMVLKNGKKIEFVSVKSMMNFYFHPEKYPQYGVKNKKDIDKMFVKDYLQVRR